MTARATIAVLAAVGGLGVLAAAGVGPAAAPAHAQSKRYPPAPVDRDSEQAARSDLWNAAITPERQPYQGLVRAATELIAQRTEASLLEATRKLDAAIQLLPREPLAYRLRGELAFERRAWPSCAADLAAADANTQRGDEPPKVVIEVRRKLGICQARSGKLGDAEQTLAETTAAGNAPGEVWLRLGEVRIAMGKLDEALAALKSALDSTEPPAQSLIRFLLATAYDRARRPADALAEAGEGVKLDRQLTVLHNAPVPPIDPGETDYMLGLAHSADPARPEHTLVYFRRFVKAAPESPWRKRAEEHIRDARTAELPSTVVRSGTASLDVDAARAAIRRAMPQLRACAARWPLAVVEVEISKSGPRTPSTDRLRPRVFSPPDGVVVRRAIGELSEDELATIDRCLQPLATRIVLPAIKERDTYYRATFHVVGP